MFDAIKAINLGFEYDQTPVIKDATFTVRLGEFIHIIGPNGGGKTTLLKLLMGFIRPSQGFLQVMGKDPKKAQAEISYVPQVFPFDKLFPISVLEVVLGGLLSQSKARYSKEDKQKALEALSSVDMLDFKNRSIGELSGGQVQRVLIARALVNNPKVLLLDEPTSCLDVDAQAKLDGLLSSLKGKMTIIAITHDLEHIQSKADRVLCIHGHIKELKSDELCSHFSMGLYNQPKKDKFFTGSYK